MSTGYGPKITTDSLICYIDPGNTSSYASPGTELVTNSNLTSIDNLYENVFRDATTTSYTSLGSNTFTANQLYSVKWRNSSRTGTTSAGLRTGYNVAVKTPNIGLLPDITYIGGWIPSSTNTGGVLGDGAGTDFNLDYMSIKSISKNVSSLVGPSRNINLINNPGYDDTYRSWYFLDPAYIEIPYNIDLHWDPGGTYGSSKKSIEMWVKTNDAAALFSKPWNGVGEYNYVLQDNRFFIISGGGGGISDGRDEFYFTSIADDKWHHIVAWLDETNYGIIIDGSTTHSAKHTQLNGLPPNGNGSIPMAIMTTYPYGNNSASLTTSNCLSGHVGLFRIYNKVLSPVEVQFNYISQAMRFR